MDIRYSTGVTKLEIKNSTFHDMITFLEYLHFMISNQTELFKYAMWKCWACHATCPGDEDWWGEWRMVTVSLIICNLATRVRWSFSEFKRSHYIDCQVLRSGGDTHAGVEECPRETSLSLCPRLRQLASLALMATLGRMSRPGFYPRHHHVLKRRVHQFWHRSTSLFTMFGKCLPGTVSMLKGPNSTLKI